MDSMHGEQIQALRTRVSSHEAVVEQAEDPKAARQETMAYVQDCQQTMQDIEHDTCSMMAGQQMHDMMQPIGGALDAHHGAMVNMSDMGEMRRETSRHSDEMMQAIDAVEDANNSSGHGCGHM